MIRLVKVKNKQFMTTDKSTVIPMYIHTSNIDITHTINILQ